MNDTEFVCQSFSLLDMFMALGVGLMLGYLTAILRHANEWAEEIGVNKVTRDTRAPRHGRLIQCPSCDQETRVFHFSWVAITCSHCGLMAEKHEWEVIDE